jgi:peptide/nickel transport system substrate-binding protein
MNGRRVDVDGRLSRRTFVATAAASLALSMARDGSALGRTPHGGRLSFYLPWSTRTVDPHDVLDSGAALFGEAIADPLFVLDDTGHPVPALAEMLPARETLGTVVRLREGLRTARKKPLDAKDVVFSIERARMRGAAAVFAEVPAPKTVKNDPLAVAFGSVDPHRLARALSSPVAAILPRQFDPTVPDGTGAFRADCSDKQIVLSRNPFAARGPAFLEKIQATKASDLATSLRQFEAERADIGWLGLGLHDDRRGAVRFDMGRAAWIVLWVDPRIGSFGAPGIAQRLLDTIAPERLSHLGLGPLAQASDSLAWGGPPMELWVDEASAYMEEVAKTLGPILSRPGREITVVALPRTEIVKRRGKGPVGLSLEVVRAVAPGTLGAWMSLVAADDPARARQLGQTPPKVAQHAPVRSLTRGLQLGVLGELRVTGGVIPEIALARGMETWDLGASYRKRK